VLETRTGRILRTQFSYRRVILQSLEKEGNQSNEDHQETELVRTKESIRPCGVLAAIRKNCWMLKPNPIRAVAVRTHASIVRSCARRVRVSASLVLTSAFTNGPC
jgi:hypothetical protein